MKLRIRLLDPEELERWTPDHVLVVSQPGLKYPAMTMKPAVLEFVDESAEFEIWEAVEFVQ